MIALEILLAFASALRCMFEILEVHDGLNHQFLIIILYMDHKLVDNLIHELVDINNEIMNARGRVEQLQEQVHIESDCMRYGM
jgi:hypothetical protein